MDDFELDIPYVLLAMSVFLVMIVAYVVCAVPDHSESEADDGR